MINWKKLCSGLLAAALVMTSVPGGLLAKPIAVNAAIQAVTVPTPKYEMHLDGNLDVKTAEGVQNIEAKTALKGTLEEAPDRVAYVQDSVKGQAIDFGANDRYGIILENTELGDAYSISFSVKANENMGWAWPICCLGDSDNWWAVSSRNNYRQALFWTNNFAGEAEEIYFDLGDQWKTYTISIVGDSASLYENGKLVKTTSANRIGLAPTNKIMFGVNPFNDDLASFYLDEVKIFDEALSAEQVQTLYSDLFDSVSNYTMDRYKLFDVTEDVSDKPEEWNASDGVSFGETTSNGITYKNIRFQGVGNLTMGDGYASEGDWAAVQFNLLGGSWAGDYVIKDKGGKALIGYCGDLTALFIGDGERAFSANKQNGERLPDYLTREIITGVSVDPYNIGDICTVVFENENGSVGDYNGPYYTAKTFVNGVLLTIEYYKGNFNGIGGIETGQGPFAGSADQNFGNLKIYGIPNKQALKIAIDTTPADQQAHYSEVSWNAYAYALATANDVYVNEESTQKAIDDATATLTAAFNGLEIVHTYEPTWNWTQNGKEWSAEAMFACKVCGNPGNPANVTATVESSIADGQITYTATAVYASVTYTDTKVEDILVTDINISGLPDVVYANDSFTLSAAVSPETAKNKTVTWSSDNAAVATVDASTGEVTAKGVGEVTIKVEAMDGSGVSKEVKIIVKPILVESIAIDGAPQEMNVNGTAQLSAIITPNTATNPAVKWTSGNGEIMSVTEEGLITANAIGETTIRATALDGSNVYGEVIIKVVPKQYTLDVQSVNTDRGTVSGETTADEGKELTFTATEKAGYSFSGWYENGALVSEKAELKVIANAENAEKQYVAKFFEHHPANAATCTQAGNPEYWTDPDEKDNTPYKDSFGKETFTADEIVIPANGHTYNVTWGEWIKSGDSYAVTATFACTECDASQDVEAEVVKGEVTDGTITYTATATYDGKTETTTKTVKVVDKTVLKNAIDAAETEKDKYTEDSWTVYEKALADAKTIYEKQDAEQTEVDDAVKALGSAALGLVKAVQSITINDAPKAMTVGDSKTLTVTVLPEDAVNKDVTWTTSDNKIATVDAEGNVVAVAPGMVTITATSNENNKISTEATIEVKEKTYTVKVTNGTLVGEKTEFKSMEQARIKADAPETGKKFNCWKDADGNIISYDSDYTFYVTKNMEVTAVYIDAEEEVKKDILLTCTSAFNAATGKVKVTVERILPVGCTVIEHGILVTKDDTIGADTDTTDPKLFNKDGKVSKVKKSGGSINGIATVNVKVSNATCYARGYVIYKDANGEQHVAYSTVSSVTVQ